MHPVKRYVSRVKPIVNLEETPGKTVGRRTAPLDPLDPETSRITDAEAWRTAFERGGVPKGVYRFNSHEEADEWLWKMLARRRES